MLETLLTKELIIFDVDVSTKDEVFRLIASALYNSKRVTDPDIFIKALYEREAIGPTNMGNGIAIPHSQTDTIKESSVVFVRLSEGVEWEGSTDLVTLVFLLAIPKSNESITHLEVISTIASLLMEEDFVDLVSTTTDREKIFDYINKEMKGE